MADKLNMSPLTMPWKRGPPAPFSGPIAVYLGPTVVDHYAVIYNEVIDIASHQLTERFDESASCLV